MLLSKQETKRVTSALSSGVSFATVGTQYYLNGIVQGGNIDGRSGNQIYAKHLRFEIVPFVSGAGTSNTIRVIIFSDHEASGGFPGITELLETANFTSPYSNINSQRRRQRILADRSFTCVGSTQTQERPVVFSLDLNFPIWFNSTDTTVTSIGKNAIFALVISGANTGTYAYQTSLQYTDS
jgi:hypothetical protein